MSTAVVERQVCLISGHDIRAHDILLDPPHVDPMAKIQLRRSEKFCVRCGRTYDEIRKGRAPRERKSNEVKDNNGQENT